MSSKTISQPAKRARTSGSNAGSSIKGPQDVAEEWAQVNNLVERRRLQNRLSQKNYSAQSFPKVIIWWNTKLTQRKQNPRSLRETWISTRCECKWRSPNTGRAVHKRRNHNLFKAQFHPSQGANRSTWLILHHRAYRLMESHVRLPQLFSRHQFWKLRPQLTPTSWRQRRLSQRLSDRERISEPRSIIWLPHFSFV